MLRMQKQKNTWLILQGIEGTCIQYLVGKVPVARCLYAAGNFIGIPTFPIAASAPMMK